MANKRIVAQLRKQLSPALCRHCEGVAETAATLAATLDVSTRQAYLAGWLHDCAREWPEETLFAFAREHGIETDAFALRHPVLLHAAVGAALAHSWGVTDSQILAAIRNHTLGYPGMSALEQLIYVADKIEPGRTYCGVDELRDLVKRDFNQGLIHVASHSMAYVLQKEQPMHPLTVSFWNWLVEKR